MSGISVSQPLPHAAALQRVYAISLYAVDQLRILNALHADENRKVVAAELMESLAEIQQTIALATPSLPDLGM